MKTRPLHYFCYYLRTILLVGWVPQAFSRTTQGEPAARPPSIAPEFDEALDQLERATAVEAAMAAKTAQLQAAEREMAGALRRTEALVVDLLEAKRHILLRACLLSLFLFIFIFIF